MTNQFCLNMYTSKEPYCLRLQVGKPSNAEGKVIIQKIYLLQGLRQIPIFGTTQVGFQSPTQQHCTRMNKYTRNPQQIRTPTYCTHSVFVSQVSALEMFPIKLYSVTHTHKMYKGVMVTEAVGSNLLPPLSLHVADYWATAHGQCS